MNTAICFRSAQHKGTDWRRFRLAFTLDRRLAPVLALVAALSLAGPALASNLPPNPALWPKVIDEASSDAELEARISELMAGMSLEEKVGQMVQAEIGSADPAAARRHHLGSVLNGGGSWPDGNAMATPEAWRKMAAAYRSASMDRADGRAGIPILWGTDAVHGHNNVVGATLFPHNIGLGAANDADLMRRIGKATALEVAATGINWTFAPTLAVARNDRWGRTYESFSEEPSLVARLGAPLIAGLQGGSAEQRFAAGRILATAKHFVGDGGTRNGEDQGDVLTDEATLAHRHGAGYVTALAAGAQTVMASFSSWRGLKMHGNKYLLTTILKERMGFDGFVIGDWNGHDQVPGCTVYACAAAINAGVDMIMVPEKWHPFILSTLRQVQAGRIETARIDDAVRRILRVKLRAGLFEAEQNLPETSVIGQATHRALAREAVRKSLVLLKNERGLLPLDPAGHIGVVGAAADDPAIQNGGWTVTWQGTENPPERYRGVTTLLQGFEAAVVAADGRISHSAEGRFDEAPDAVILVFGEQPYAEGEGDRESLLFSARDAKPLRIMRQLRRQGVPVVAVFLSGRAMLVNEEIDAVDAFVAAWLPGSEGAGVADLLFADPLGRDFTGKLPFSWPQTEYQARLGLNRDDDTYTPRFPFGYGLTYAD